ncbi:MAG TPA: Uma2 family endonuclease [Thermoanaerobaculia bacterium]|nr:Uma2 family endonuclease [Thermoanaerobaculia bacterium]
MHAAALNPDRDDLPHEDHFVFLHDVSWADYQHILEVRGDHSGPRISYLEGELEIMSPSENHERIKSLLGSLVEMWCVEHRIQFTRVGSWTLKNRAVRRGAEPDDCFVLGASAKAQRPDFAIEVIWTSGSLDKLEIYRMLGVREVWIWERGILTPYVLRDDHYEVAARSEALPGIDLRQLAAMAEYPTTLDAMLAWGDLIRTPHP